MTVTGRAYTRLGLGAIIIAFFSWFACIANAAGDWTSRELALRLFRRLNGIPLQLSDPRLTQMEQLIGAGKLKDAAAVATADPAFYRLTVKQWATRLSNREESPYEPLNDFSAMVVGVTKDNLDSRLLLSGNFAYQVNGIATARSDAGNDHYALADSTRVDLKANLVRIRPQRQGLDDAAGLLTTRAWAMAHYNMGTNRRAVEFSLQEFLCTPIARWKESGISDSHVRRDVERRPGGNAATYQNHCRGCHASMDAMGGAFARFDFENNRLVSYGPAGVAKKMNRNATVYPEGARILDDSWETPGTSNHRELFGWRGQLRGTGVREFGLLLANSERFKSCLAERVFTELCSRDPNAREKERDIPKVAEAFEQSGYKLKSLFEDVATLPTCLGLASERATPGINHFRQVREYLAATTEVDPLTPAIAAYYTEAITRLPKNGVIEEMNGTAMLAITALSGLFCRELVLKDKAIAPQANRRVHAMIDFGKSFPEISKESREQWITALTRRFWQRDPRPEELKSLQTLLDRAQNTPVTLEQGALVLCTAVAASLDSISK